MKKSGFYVKIEDTFLKFYIICVGMFQLSYTNIQQVYNNMYSRSFCMLYNIKIKDVGTVSMI